MVYRVVSDDVIEILTMGKPERSKWTANHPFDNYPLAFPRTSIQVMPVAPDVIAQCITPIAADGYANIARSEVLEDSCRFPRVGGRQFMWQGIPDWECPTTGCQYAGKDSDEGKEVFAVIWERPILEFHLWANDDPKYQDIGSGQIIFSRCIGCGVVHSCNRCD